ncbi:MAG TPA: TrkA family potassium uptake protein [Candidatus Deferrimicrobium sp.]|nr:TrkA family potassium uptake protein [Candidatus Deferrimicrobium sp.]
MRFIVIGCGRWGAGLARTLAERGHDPSVVDADLAAFERLGEGFHGDRVAGSGLDRDVLVRAGIERASGLAAVTFSDEINVAVARAAREVFRVPKVVARLYDPQKAQIYRRLGIETISTVEWGVNRIADLLAYSTFDVSVSIGHGGVDIAEVEVPLLLAGRTVAELAVPGEAHVIALSREGRTFLPTEGTLLAAGDRVHLVLVPSAVGRLERLLGIG